MSEAALRASGSCDEKHIVLDNSIRNIQGVLEKVNEIISRVTGGDCAVKNIETNVASKACLFEVLNEGGHRINDKCSEIHKALSELENSLF